MEIEQLHALTDGIIAKTRGITPSEALAILNISDENTLFLFACSDRIRRHFRGNKIHVCAIANVKSGRCSEDCGFCSQSAHVKTGVPEYGLMSNAEVTQAHDLAETQGAKAFGLVAAWKGLNEGPTLDAVVDRVKTIARRHAEGKGPRADASLGIISEPAIAQRLKAAGLACYNHNLETAPSYFGEICKTHTFDDRIRTITLMREAGVKICSGGIIGMGETLEHRVELAFALQKVQPEMLPLNFFNPIEGTTLVVEKRAKRLTPMECLKTIAMFRFVLPEAHIMVAGGREVNLGELQSFMYSAGASATMVGNYLTTTGRNAKTDLDLIESLGLVADGAL